MTKSKKTAKDKNVARPPKTEPKAMSGEEKNKQLEGQLKRALADYQNLERRVEEERKLLSTLSSALLIEKLLPVLDNLENAQKHLNDEGLEMVIKQFNTVLEEEGVVEIEAKGTQFDPNLHEATEVIEGEKDNQVVNVIRKGYKINDRVLRPAQVSVQRSSQEQFQNIEKETQENV